MFDIKEANLKKQAIQVEAVRLSKKHDNLLLSWATGTSKTKAALEVMDSMTKMPSGLGKVYIVLKETNHEQNWKDELLKWKMWHFLPNIEFFCYASLHLHQNEEVSLIILDEVHALSEIREDYLKTIKSDKIISLSATPNRAVRERLNSYKPGLYEYKIPLQMAIDSGLVPKPSIYIAYIDLDNKEKKYEWKSPKTKKIGGYSILLTAKTYYERLEKKIEWWDKSFKKDGHSWQENRWIQNMGLRKKLMAKLKTDAAKILLENIKGKRFICFTGSIEQCEELGGDHAIHSKMLKQKREMLIKLFNDGDIDDIYAVGMLREGMNLNKIEAGVIVQLDNQKGSFEQMAGRSLRAIAPELYILILRGTKDEEYLDHATRGISSQYITEYIWPEPKESLILQT